MGGVGGGCRRRDAGRVTPEQILARLRRLQSAVAELARSGLGRPERDRLEGKVQGIAAARRAIEDMIEEEGQ